MDEFLVKLQETIGCEEKLAMDTELTGLADWDSFSAVAFIALANCDYGKRLEKKDVVTAQVYLDRFQSMTDRTDWHYDALKYKRALAYDLPIGEKIDILQELKKKELLSYRYS